MTNNSGEKRLAATRSEATEEEWTKEHLDNDARVEIGVTPYWAIRDGYSRLALTWAEVDADAILSLHTAARAGRDWRELALELLSETGPCLPDAGGRPYCVAHHQFHPCSSGELRDRVSALDAINQGRAE